MNITLDGKTLEHNIDSTKTIGEILGELEAACEQKGSTITGIKIDEKEIEASELDNYFLLQSDLIKKIELTTSSSKSILSMAHDLGVKFLELSKNLTQMSVQLHTGSDKDAIKTVNEFTIEIQNFFRLIPLLPMSVEHQDKLIINNESIDDFIIGMKPFLEEFLEGLASFDTVLLGDIAEYEISPRLETLGEWLNSL